MVITDSSPFLLNHIIYESPINEHHPEWDEILLISWRTSTRKRRWCRV